MWLSNAKKRTGGRPGRRALRPGCEVMEGRQLLSGITATLNSTSNPAYGPTGMLQVTGTSNADVIELTESNGVLSVAGVSIAWRPSNWGGTALGSSAVAASAVSQVRIQAGSGNETVKIDPGTTTPTLVFGGSGTDTLIAGGSNDTIFAGSVPDTIISLGGTHNAIFGGASDSFWYDGGTNLYGATGAEQSAGMIHPINAFAAESQPVAVNLPSLPYLTLPTTPTLQLNGQALPDPLITVPGSTPENYVPGAKYKNFASDPLFAPGGPTAADVTQGDIGDCQTLSALLGIVSKDPAAIRQMIVGLGDGTYAVNFKPGGVDKYIRVNADLPVDANGNILYAKLGQGNSTWVALVEKAWTFERPTSGLWWTQHVGTYTNIDGGGPGEILADLDISTTSTNTSNIFDCIVNAAADGEAVEVCTVLNPLKGSVLVGSHCYYVDHINYTTVYIPKLGAYTYASSVTLRNPWGNANTWVTVTASDIDANVSSGVESFD